MVATPSVHFPYVAVDLAVAALDPEGRALVGFTASSVGAAGLGHEVLDWQLEQYGGAEGEGRLDVS